MEWGRERKEEEGEKGENVDKEIRKRKGKNRKILRGGKEGIRVKKKDGERRKKNRSKREREKIDEKQRERR